VPLTLIAHLESLAEGHNKILHRLSQLINPRQRVLGARKEPVPRQIVEEQRDVQLNRPRANQEDSYYHKHFGFPPFQGDSNNKAERSKYSDLSSDQNVKVPLYRKDSLMLNPLSVDELQRIHTRIDQEYSEPAQMEKEALDEYLEGWTITCTEFQPRKRKRYRKQIRKAKLWKRSNQEQGQQPSHQVHNDHVTQTQTSQVL
jgi:hypothetical protein